MRTVRLAHETDFDGWRAAARALRAAGAPPEAVVWSAGGQGELGEAASPAEACTFAVPREFVDVARDVVLHRDPARFALLYRLLWRLQAEPALMHLATDADVARARDLQKAVERATYRLKQYVRFREIDDEEGQAYVAWIEPEHRVLERAAPFFVERFANMRWAIFTPDRCASWDGEGRLSFAPGVSRDQAPAEDALEDVWRAYFSSTFNPARLKVKAMTAQMPKSLWRNLPEAQVIPKLIQQAATRTEAMVGAPHSEPNKRTARAVARSVRDGSYDDAYVPASVDEVWTAVQACRRCDLWRDATQGVAGEGPARAGLMFVGEQPGDQEDLAGKPFVGPAGQMFDRALEEAGVERAQAYVTNAVKHFKHEPRGKRRIHAKPNVGEIKACRWWLEHERRLVRPKVIVALGATAGRAVFDRPVAVNEDRGRPVPLTDGAVGLLTVHPSYLLRLPDEMDRVRAWKLFVQDLRAARELVGG